MLFTRILMILLFPIVAIGQVLEPSISNDYIFRYPEATAISSFYPLLQYANANYFICQPENSQFFDIGCEKWYGAVQDSFLVANAAGPILENLKLRQNNKYIGLDLMPFRYECALKLHRQGEIGLYDTLGYFDIRRNDSLIFKDYLLGRDVPVGRDTVLN